MIDVHNVLFLEKFADAFRQIIIIGRLISSLTTCRRLPACHASQPKRKLPAYVRTAML